MTNAFAYWFALLAVIASFGQPKTSTPPKVITIPSGNLRLKAYLWKPTGPGPFPAVLFNHGSGGEDAAHTAGRPITEAAERLAPVFLKHGYAFVYLFRRGQGLSADQAPFMQDLLKKEQATHGIEARQRLQFKLMSTDHLEDVMAALFFLKTVPGIDRNRIAVSGHSFGGQLTLLAAERDPTVRVAVTFAAAAASWTSASDIRTRLLEAVRNTQPPIMLIHAANDYDTAPGRALAEELERLHRPHLLKIYPPCGMTSDDGHNLVYENIQQWEDDVFGFLDRNIRH